MTQKKGKIDLHLHSTVSDGTETPEELLRQVKNAGIGLFSITDHDAVSAGGQVLNVRKADDPWFIAGVEFSCRDEEGKYHILGYGFDPEAEAVNAVVKMGHGFRMEKILSRLEYLKKEFGVDFPEEEVSNLLTLDNPGKPHIGNLMVKYGFAETKEEAIKEFINRIHFSEEYVRPEAAIRGILDSGGIPVLGHPSYGSGDELIVGEEMDKRLRKLMSFGLQGVEAYYSGFTEKIRQEVLSFADRYGLYVTAGSDYHGKNKLVELGDIGLEITEKLPEGLQRFLKTVKIYR